MARKHHLALSGGIVVSKAVHAVLPDVDISNPSAAALMQECVATVSALDRMAEKNEGTHHASANKAEETPREGAAQLQYTCPIPETGMVRDRTDWRTIPFLLGLSLLVCHELDAMTHQEWLLLPVFNALPGEMVRIDFAIAHMPLFTQYIPGTNR